MAGARSPARRWAIRLAGSAVLLGFLFWLLPHEAILGAVRSVSAGEFGIMLAGFLVLHVVAAAKWWWMMDRRVPLPLAIRAHFAGLTANLGLPGATGGDAVRAMLAHMHMRDGSRVVAAAMVDRLIDSLALALLSFSGLVMLGLSGGSAGTLFTGAGILAAATVLVFLLPRLLPLPWRLFPKLPARGLAERLAAALAEFGARPGTLAGGFVLAFAIQAGLVLLAYIAIRHAAAPPALAAWIFAWPLAKVIAILPVSLNGLGLREGTLAALLVPLGAQGAQVVAAGLVWQGVLFAAGLLGGLLYLSTPGARKTVTE